MIPIKVNHDGVKASAMTEVMVDGQLKGVTKTGKTRGAAIGALVRELSKLGKRGQPFEAPSENLRGMIP